MIQIVSVKSAFMSYELLEIFFRSIAHKEVGNHPSKALTISSMSCRHRGKKQSQFKITYFSSVITLRKQSQPLVQLNLRIIPKNQISILILKLIYM